MEIGKPSWVKKFNISERLGLIILFTYVIQMIIIHIVCLRINSAYKSYLKLCFIIGIAEQNNEEKKWYPILPVMIIRKFQLASQLSISFTTTIWQIFNKIFNNIMFENLNWQEKKVVINNLDFWLQVYQKEDIRNKKDAFVFYKDKKLIDMYKTFLILFQLIDKGSII